MEWISTLFEQYGYFVLFAGLFAESLALPFPGELAMAISGHMSTIGSFHIPAIIMISYFGAILGTVVTYYLGSKLGTTLFERNGKFLFMNKERLDKITRWFDKYGNKLILVSYFIPGLRHFTGYTAGILQIRFRTFLLYNCLGGFVWVLTYVMIGNFFGLHIEQLLHTFSQYSIAAFILLAVILMIIVLLRRHKEAVVQWILKRRRRHR
ncbi:DedA family protein [Paenibacillus mendelii]|uniref:DedA family protein n=1 Tax=Paenibacillus mendelii TaxID=206163 RepID=A0ABV6JFK4_9BACL|nr:DedA family protein [Paenibacillus mendelii]MCQ6557573.1 DedA family protein [Paenibacillus mendelii]